MRHRDNTVQYKHSLLNTMKRHYSKANNVVEGNTDETEAIKEKEEAFTQHLAALRTARCRGRFPRRLRSARTWNSLAGRAPRQARSSDSGTHGSCRPS